MSASKALLSTAIGALILAILLIAFLGLDNARTLFALSIACTLGIGGVFWAVVAFGLGLTIITLIEAVRGDHAPRDTEADPQAKALTTYVNRALQAGANDDQLLRRLQRQGWTEEEVIQAIAQAQGNPDRPNAPGAA